MSDLSSQPDSSPRWQLRPVDAEQVTRLAAALNVSPTVARVLVNRKITTPEQAERFLKADLRHIHPPHLLKDMDKAVTRLQQALRAEESICIYGDYDVDGAVATAMLLIFFRELGRKVDFYIPNRVTEGYSLNRPALDEFKRRGIRLLITVDNGIMANAEAAYARELGLDVVITDHHQVGEALPEAVAVINPQRRDCGYPFKGICGAGVAYKLLLALRQALREDGFFRDRPEPNLKHYLDLLCLPTVCDVVPLVDENRLFVKEGLKHLQHTRRPGLKALLKVCGSDRRELNSYDLGFRLGPRLNACGRLMDASLGVRLLISEDPGEALALALELDRLNEERRTLEQDIAVAALQRIRTGVDLEQTLGITVFDPAWHIGVVGIVASRLVERLHRPVFVLAHTESGLIKGSGRSIPGVNLVKALTACSDLFLAFGGHEAAAGLTMAADRLDEFTRRFDAAVKAQITTADLTRTVWIDAELTPEAISDALARELALLEPFGMGNAKPLFAATSLPIQSKRIVGEHHLKLRLGDAACGFDAIAFNKSEAYARLGPQTGLLFGLEINEFNGAQNVQLVIKDFF